MTASRTGAGIRESAEEVKSIEEFDGNSEEVPCDKDDLRRRYQVPHPLQAHHQDDHWLQSLLPPCWLLYQPLTAATQSPAAW